MLATHLNGIQLSNDRGMPIWKWSKNKQFTMRSVYDHLTRNGNGPTYKAIWKAKIPDKVKIFMWLVAQKSILTKDNLIKRKGNPTCYFCGAAETVEHLLFECPVAKFVWGVVAISFHQSDRPSSYEQFECWVMRALPGGKEIYMFGLAVICWAIIC
jgi:hypothetical protein